MADDTKDRRSSGQTTDSLAADPSVAKGSAKRPYATLDLKATEIKITRPTRSSVAKRLESKARHALLKAARRKGGE